MMTITQNTRKLPTIRLPRPLILCIALLALFVLLAGTAQADGPNRAGLVVRYGDGAVWSTCVTFSEPQISGIELLRRSGLNLTIEEGGVYGGAVCKIEQDGCEYPLDDCFCQCMGVDCTYWAYYLQQPGGGWSYSNAGAGGTTVHNGDVQGWSWGPGSFGSSGTEPPAAGFDQVCPALATATPTPPPTATPTVPPTHTPTLRPTATPTSTPTGGALNILFSVDRTEVTKGQCATLNWQVSGAAAAYLNDQGVTGEETRQVCPPQDTIYSLRVVGANGQETTREITVRVLPATLTPAAGTPTSTPTRAAGTRQPTATRLANLVQATPTLLPINPSAGTVIADTPTPAELLAQAQPTSETPTPLPIDATPAPSTALAMAMAPVNTPQVWSQARQSGAVEQSLVPTPGAARAESRTTATLDPFVAGSRLLLNYGLFFFLAAALTGLAIWALRRQMA